MGNLIPRLRSYLESVNMIPCFHNQNSVVYGGFQVKLKVVQRERLLYHYPDGKVVKSKIYFSVSTNGKRMYAVSPPLNPIDCTHCEAMIVEIYDSVRVRGRSWFSSGVQALSRYRQVASNYLASGRSPRGFFIVHDIGFTVEVHVSIAGRVVDRHPSLVAASGRAIIASLQRVVPVPLDMIEEVCCVCLEGLTDEDGRESKDRDMETGVVMNMQALALDKEQCCFSLEAFIRVEDKETGVVMKMPCGHMFHGHCILEWLLSSRRCPLCRSQI